MRFLHNILAKAGLIVDGVTQLNTIANATIDTDKFLVSDGGVIKYRTGAQLGSDIGAANLAASTLKHQVKLGEAINKGQAVYVSSSDGTNMIASKASNASEATSSKTLGLIETSGVLNDQVNVITEGLLAGLDTSTANAGDPVWLGTGGNLIFGLANKPYAPAHLVFIGIVTRVQQNNGEIFVKVQNGFELKEIHDVQITTTPSNNTVLAYESATSLYKMKSIATLLGYTPADDSLVVHLAGTETITGAKTFSSALTLSTVANATIDTDRFLVSDSGVVKYRTGAEVLSDIGAQPLLTNPVTGTGTTNYLPKFTSSSAIGNSAMYESGGTFFTSTNALNVRTNTSRANITTDADLVTQNGLGILATSTTYGQGYQYIRLMNSASAYTGSISQTESTGIGLYSASALIFGSSSTERMRLDASGNLGINTSSPTSPLTVYALNNTAAIRVTNGPSANNAGITLESLGGNVVLNNGNGPLEVSTGGSLRMTLTTSGNLGLGVTPSAWSTANSVRALQFNTGSIYTFSTDRFFVGQNTYIDATGVDDYYANGFASRYQQYQGQHIWQTAPSGTANAAITWSTRMTLDNSGNLGLGVSPSAWSLGKAMQFTSGAVWSLSTTDMNYLTNTNYDGSFKYINSTRALRYFQDASTGIHAWYNAPSGTAGNAISFTQAMTLDASGRLGIGVIPVGSDGLLNVNIGGSTFHLGYGANYDNYYTSGASGVHIFRTGGSERMRITSGGNVGIGSTSPESITTYRTLQVTGGGVSTGGIFTTTTSDGSLKGRFLTSGGEISIGAVTNSPLVMFTNDTERMRITSAGLVGIGTSSPSTQLQVNGTPSASWGNLTLFDNRTAGITQGGVIALGGYKTTTSAGALFAQIAGRKENSTAGNEAGYLAFITNDNAALSERMRITSGGNVGIGISSPNANDLLSVVGNSSLINTSYKSSPRAAGYMYWRSGGDATERNVAVASIAGWDEYNGGQFNGSLKFYTQTSNSLTEKMQLTSSGELLINTTSDAGDYKLQVNGNVLGIGTASNSSTIRIEGGSGANTNAILDLTGRGSGNQYNNTEIRSLGQSTNGGILAFYTDDNTSALVERMRITSGGDVAIGSTTPASIGTGIRVLDVQGTNAGGIALGVSGTKSYIYGAATMYLDANTTLSVYTSGSEKMRITNSGNVLIGTTTDGGYKLDVSGTFRNTLSTSTDVAQQVSRFGALNSSGQLKVLDIYYTGSSNLITLRTQAVGTDPIIGLQIGSSNPTMYVNSSSVGIGGTPNASAKLQVESTTQGFLPPRMTQTQRDAITTPATGLIIFQTDNNAGFYFYNGTAWKALAIVQ